MLNPIGCLCLGARKHIRLFTFFSAQMQALFESRKPSPLGVVRDNWLCLKETDRSIGVMEYWSIDLGARE